LQKWLIGFQIALAVLLSGSAGLMVRSLIALTSVESGIRDDDVIRAQVSLPAGRYAADGPVWSFYDRVLERLRNTGGINRAAVMSGLPPLRRANNTSFLLDGKEMMDHTSIHQVDFIQHISPSYLSTLQIRLLAGRDLNDGDTERSAPSALVNQMLAERFWPGESALGHRLKPAGIGNWFTVVGVVADVRQAGIQSPPAPEIYVAHRQARLLLPGFMPRTMNLVVHSNDGLATVSAAVRAAVREADPAAAISGLAGMQEVIGRTIAQPRLLAWMFSAFAALALVVAAMGVYAVTSYSVGTRTSEFGVRMALGARPADVLGLVVRGGLGTIAAGVAAGTLGTAVSARLLQNIVFGVGAIDPLSLAAGASAILVAALAATLLPARRASRVDPIIALRDP
jgi:predicted permease